MAGGLGLYSVVVKDGDGVVRVREVMRESFTPTDSTQQTKSVIVPNLGDIVGFVYEITASVDSASTNPKSIDNVVKEISIHDNRENPIWDGVSGSDLRIIEYVKGPKGKIQTVPTVSTSSQTVRFLIPHHIDVKDQNVRLQMLIGAYSDLSDDATTGSASVVVKVLYKDGATTSTARLRVLSHSVGSGINNLQPSLPMGAFINEMVIKGDESKFSEVVFSRDGAEEMRADLTVLKAYAQST